MMSDLLLSLIGSSNILTRRFRSGLHYITEVLSNITSNHDPQLIAHCRFFFFFLAQEFSGERLPEVIPGI